MPFLVGLLEHDHPHLGYVLDLVRDKQKLWSPHDLRSLLSDEFYGKDENYWRGPVWININFLVVQRLLVRRSSGYSQRTKFEILRNDYRKCARNEDHIKRWHDRSIPNYDGMLFLQSTNLGRTLAMRGNNIILILAPAKERNISRVGPRLL